MSKKKIKLLVQPKIPVEHVDFSAHIMSEADVKASMEAVAKHNVCCEIYGEPNKNLDVFVPHGVVSGRISCKGPNLSSIPKLIDYAEMELRILSTAAECPHFLPKGPKAIPKIEFDVHVDLPNATLTFKAKRVTHTPETRAVTISFETCTDDPEFVKEWLKEEEEAAAHLLAGDSKYLIYRTGRYLDFSKSPKDFIESESTKVVKDGMKAVANVLGKVAVPMGHMADAMGYAAHAADKMLAAYGKFDAVITEKFMKVCADEFNKENGWDIGSDEVVPMWDSISPPVARETGITDAGYQTLVRYGVRLKG